MEEKLSKHKTFWSDNSESLKIKLMLWLTDKFYFVFYSTLQRDEFQQLIETSKERKTQFVQF